ncbi:FkbM family methyltransferase [Roseovarius sp. SCSIO 43702]|uniref:FkbM family methyltransferase n=1 Tax=Roseovarius sp. SCSIO 43702 TaxID=2823043 RepID=UPI001C73D1F3|nr:FkbM family methyltransferase [Roseovarius sp. SCSIO 43702]QYX58382.1 FkbM family methyltransferase [Roseovarius sp. SCSIO 43702]
MASLKKWLDRRRNPWKGVFYDAFKLWKAENGPARLYAYDTLPEGATVLDFGGFEGTWADRILAAQPSADIHVFEPHPVFAAHLTQKFAERENVHVHAFALGRTDGTLSLSDTGDASSAVADLEKSLEAPVKAVSQFFDAHPLPAIDLVKINIEGGEYDLLPALLDAGVMDRIARLQVQFHLFDPAFAEARDAIRTRLSETHDCAWCYPFVWEEWRRRT